MSHRSTADLSINSDDIFRTLRNAKRANPHNHADDSFKKLVCHAATQGLPPKKIANAAGICLSTLYSWVKASSTNQVKLLPIIDRDHVAAAKHAENGPFINFECGGFILKFFKP